MNARRILQIDVFDKLLDDRQQYVMAVKTFVAQFERERCIVLLDPDTGLQPNDLTLRDLSNAEVGRVWESIKPGDVLACCEHQTNRIGQMWINAK